MEKKKKRKKDGKKTLDSKKRTSRSPSASAAPLFVLPARRLPEVRHGAKLGRDGPPVVEPALQSLHALGSGVLVGKLRIDRTRQMVRNVVADVQGLQLAELRQLLEDVLVEVLKVVLGTALLFGGQGLRRRRR